MKVLNKIPLFLLAILLVSCDGVEDSLIDDRLEENPLPGAPSYTAGSTDFTTFVSIGNSLTAGLMDGALYNDGQANSLPAQMANSFAAAGGGEFNQPDINSENGFNSTFSDVGAGIIKGRTVLDLGGDSPAPFALDGELPTAYTGNKATLNNFGVPGVTVGDLLVATSPNPALSTYYYRFASAPGTSTIIGDAAARQPSFVHLWIGNNDILGYAAGGAANEAILTSTADFSTRFNAVMGTLMANTTADGVVSTIPLITVAPYFRAVSYDAIPLDEATATAINTGLAAVNSAFDALAANSLTTQAEADRRKTNYVAGANPILVHDDDLDDFGPLFDALQGAGAIDAAQRAALAPYEQSRPLVAGELVMLTAGAVLGTDAAGANTTIGAVIPLGYNLADPASSSGDGFFLDAAEQGLIAQRIGEFNGVIATAVAGSGGRFILHDVNNGIPGLTLPGSTGMGYFADLFGFDGTLGIIEQGVTLLPDFSPNGVSSTDGVHPNQRGYALWANEILELIEAEFGANLPSIDVLELPGISLR